MTSEKNFKTWATSKDLVLLLIFNFSISVTNARPTTKENICVSTNLFTINIIKSRLANTNANMDNIFFSKYTVHIFSKFSERNGKTQTRSKVYLYDNGVFKSTIAGMWKFFAFNWKYHPYFYKMLLTFWPIKCINHRFKIHIITERASNLSAQLRISSFTPSWMLIYLQVKQQDR